MKRGHSRSPPWLLHVALIMGQVFFGMGSVIAALGLPACNPFAFALYREIAAGAILLGLSCCRQRQEQLHQGYGNAKPLLLFPALKNPQYASRFALLGLAIFGNQAGMIAGIKLAGPVVAAVWQPSQPIIAAAIGMVLGWEPWQSRRVAGVVIAFVGCASMVLLATTTTKSKDEGTTVGDASLSNTSTVSTMIGHTLFFVNCLSTTIYVLLSKGLLRVYSPLLVTAWSYIIASFFMGITTLLLSWSQEIMTFICPDCQDNNPWMIPSGAWFALVYFILFGSVGAYALLTWANSQPTTGTLVISYTVLQPVTAALLTTTLLALHWYPSCQTTMQQPDVTTSAQSTDHYHRACLTAPGLQSIVGMAGIFVGLALVIQTEPQQQLQHSTKKPTELQPTVARPED